MFKQFVERDGISRGTMCLCGTNVYMSLWRRLFKRRFKTRVYNKYKKFGGKRKLNAHNMCIDQLWLIFQ
ncbi:unnamed protein product [Leptidea sinapis]|uniref:Uncharacterized protein n=1 Tax=Leptidea sinapis TaxID=189913 RepID=A0A5E4QE44_9NEOP|nr:unnamed protein product [Leptidea sinapis]